MASKYELDPEKERPRGRLVFTEQFPCGHCPARPHRSRGMCNPCYKRWLRRTGRTRDLWRPHVRRPKVNDPLAPRGDRIEFWKYKTRDCERERFWAVEISGNRITGAFGPMTNEFAWKMLIANNKYGADGMIIRHPVVIGVIERRRDEFKRIS